MNPIELGKAIAEVGIPIITAVMLILVVGLVWYLIKRQTKREDKHDAIRLKKEEKHDKDQKEERDYYRDLIKNDLQKNAILNTKGLELQRGMMKDLQDHNGHSEKFSEKVIETLSLQTDAITLVCNKLNGDSPSMREAKKRLNKDRRKVSKKVEVERRR